MTGLDLLSDAQVLGLTGAAEARSELVPGHGWQPAPIANMMAVMCTPINRVKADPKRFGSTVTEACDEREQYSCWNPEAAHRIPDNHDWLIGQVAALVNGTYVAPIVRQCIAVAAQLLDGDIADSVSGGTHYFSPVSMQPSGSVPNWSVGKTPVARIADQFLFYKGV